MVIGPSTEYAYSFRDLEPIFLALVTDPKDWWLASNNCGQTVLMVTVSLVFIGQKFKSQATQAVSSAGRKTGFNTRKLELTNSGTSQVLDVIKPFHAGKSLTLISACHKAHRASHNQQKR